MTRLGVICFVSILSVSSNFAEAGKLGKRFAAAAAVTVAAVNHDEKKQAKAASQAAEPAPPPEPQCALRPYPSGNIPSSDRFDLYGATNGYFEAMIVDKHLAGSASAPPVEEISACGKDGKSDGELITAVVLSGVDKGKTFNFFAHPWRSETKTRLASCFQVEIKAFCSNCAHFELNGNGSCQGKLDSFHEDVPQRELNDEFVLEAKEMMNYGSKEFMFMELLWPAFEAYKERARNPQQEPKFKGQAFDRICKNTFNKDDSALAKKWEKSFGYERCGDNDENFYKVLSWFDRATKDYEATANWLDFSLWSPDKLVDPIFSGGAHKNIWLMAYNFNMYVAAELIQGDAKQVLLPYYRSQFLQNTSIMREAATNIFDVNNLDEVKKKARNLDLYEEEIAFYASLLDDPEDYGPIIDAFLDAADSGLSPDEKTYRKLYENFSIVDACYAATRNVLGNYVSYDQHQQAKQKLANEESQLSLSRSQKSEIRKEIDAESSQLRSALAIGVWDSYSADMCEAMLMVHMGYL